MANKLQYLDLNPRQLSFEVLQMQFYILESHSLNCLTQQ